MNLRWAFYQINRRVFLLCVDAGCVHFNLLSLLPSKRARLEPPRTDECHQVSRHLPQLDFVTEPVPRNKVRSTLPLSLLPLRSPLQLGPGTRIRARVSQSCSACPQPVHSLWPLSFLDQRATWFCKFKSAYRGVKGGWVSYISLE